MSRRVTGRGRVEGVDTFVQGIRALGDRLGPIRVKVPQARDDGFLRLLLDSLDPELRLALDFRDESWEGPDVDAKLDDSGVTRVGSLAGPGAFRYLRLREGPYDEGALAACAERLRPLLGDGIDVYCYFRHEDEPTAPVYAARLLELVGGDVSEQRRGDDAGGGEPRGPQEREQR